MTERRQPRTPPELPGYTVVRLIGLGGFADVFLYRQQLPSREVAVKVLLEPTLDDEARERFVTEANLMAQLSHHPAIVTVHHAAFAEDGRPYLVMEYCSRPGLAERYRSERMSVAESLRIGVRLASAVQTAHDAGILHRDIKPANVLTTDFGWPALTDFGIAATGRQRGGAAVGMSIPWAPPELLGSRPSGDERSDVYSLGATLYSLLAGRSPFEVPGLSNGAGELVSRIERMPLPAIGRPDVPAELADALARTMAKNPARRFDSALAVARVLQQVEAELGLPATAVDISGRGPGPHTPGADQEDATRIRAVQDIGPAAGLQRTAGDDATRVRPVLDLGPAAGTAVVAPPADRVDPARSGPALWRRPLVGVVAAALLVVLVVVAAALVHRGDPVRVPAPTDFRAGPASVDTVVPAPTSLAGTRQPDGSVVFTWANPAPAAGDSYLWGVLTLTGDVTLARVDDTRVVVPAGSSPGQVCVQVSVRRSDGRYSSRPAQGCVP